MSAEVIGSRTSALPVLVPSGLLTLAAREAWRMLVSPAVACFLVYFALVGGLGAVTDPGQFADRAVLSELVTFVCFLMLGLVTFIAAHLVATSSRRSMAESQLASTPMDPVRRDMALCLGVLLGPVMVALGLALVGAWLASGVSPTRTTDPQVDLWTWTDVVQVPAMVLGAGILGIVVARWLPIPGSLILGFVGMVAFTVWVASHDGGGLGPWLTWYAVNPEFSDSAAVVPTASMGWHAAYLVAWSGVGVCAVGLRQSEHKGRWLVAAAVAVTLLVVAAVTQVPPDAVQLDL